MIVQLQSDLSTGERDGDVVNLPDEQAEHLINIGAAIATDAAVTPQAEVKDVVATVEDKGVETATPPLSDLVQASQPDPQVTQPVAPAEPSTPQESDVTPAVEQPNTSVTQAPVSSEPSPDLHLG